MIVQDAAEGYWLIRQEDHAHLTGELAARWTEPPAMRSAMVAAARLHDNGWREADEAPTVDGDGRPHSYRTLPDAPYLDVWRRGIARAAAIDPQVGLLVGLHGARFLRTDHSDAHRAFHHAERAREDAALKSLGWGGSWNDLPVGVARASDLVAFLDALSLFACGEWSSPWTGTWDGTTYSCARSCARSNDRVVTVTPWPFDAPFAFEVVRIPFSPTEAGSAPRLSLRFEP